MQLCGAVLLALAVSVTAYNVETQLIAPWPSSPFFPLQEASEYLADENVALYHDFLGRVAASPVGESASWNQTSKKVLDLSNGTLPVLSQQVMLAAVETRAYSAAIETHRQLSLVPRAACGKAAGAAWATLSISAGAESPPNCLAVCSAEELSKALGSSFESDHVQSKQYGHQLPASACSHMEFDHIVGGNNGKAHAAAASVILYAVLGTPQFSTWHNLLSGMASSPRGVQYTFRHTLPASGTWPTSFLSGYGVGLDVKKMEYKAVDDRGLIGSESSETITELAANGTSHVEWLGDGFAFERFVRLAPAAVSDVQAGDDSDNDNKAVYGIAAAHYLASVAREAGTNGSAADPLSALQRLTGNLPLALPALKRITVPPAVHREVRGNSRFLGGVNAVLINGRIVDATSPAFNLFALLRTLQQEAAMLAAWEALPLPPATVRAVKALGGTAEAAADAAADGAADAPSAGAPGGDVLRVDVRRGAKGLIVWLNNIEKDAQFHGWKRSVRALLQPAWGMPSVKRNLFTAVFVVDPASPGGLRALASLVYFARSANPVRLGLVFTVPPSSPDYVHVAPRGAAAAGDVAPLPQHDEAAPASSLQLNLLLAKATAEHGTSAATMVLEHMSTAWQRAVMDAQGAAGGFGDDAALDKLPPLPLRDAVQAYATSVQATTGAWSQSAAAAEAADALRDADGELRAVVRRHTAYVAARGLPVPCTTVNGRVYKGLSLQSTMSEAVGADLKILQGLVQTGALTDAKLRKTSPLSVLLDSSVAMPRYSEALLGAERNTLPVAAPAAQAWLEQLPWLAVSADAVPAANASALVFADLSSASGAALAADALSHIAPRGDEVDAEGADAAPRTDLRVALLHLAPWDADASGAAAATVLHCLAQAGDLPLASVADIAGAALAAAPSSVHAAGVLAAAAAAAAAAPGWGDAVSSQTCTDADSAAYGHARQQASAAAAQGLALVQAGTAAGVPVAALAVNARLFRADTQADIDAAIPNLGAALGVEMAHNGHAIAAIVADSGTAAGGQATGEGVSGATAAVAAAAALAQYTADGKREAMPEHMLHKDHTGFVASPAPGAVRSALDVVAVLDPVSAAAQRAAPLLLMARDWLGATVRVYLNPAMAGGDGPVQSFYRFVAPGTQVLHSGNPHHLADRAVFTHVPPDPMLLTMKVYPPEPWNVQALHAEHDMDNLKLGLPGMPDTVRVQYELKNLLVAGQCEDLTHAKPPNGLQLQLRAPSSDNSSAAGGELVPAAAAAPGVFSDSLVMQNLGYFQLKANPGVWEVALAPGRAAELYSIVHSSQGGDGGLRRVGRRWYEDDGEEGGAAEALVPAQPVVVRDFTGRVTQLRVKKRPGQEGEKLLATLGGVEGGDAQGEVTASGLWGSVRSMFGGGAPPASSNDTIHVFSLASGHLYERFLRIMMLSVTKRASRPVHFWLVENFLSPAFKDTIQYMAQRYGFDVSYVTYKWPNWLNGQTEKQRIIWGYKILFLDVLFPLDVKKIITVDADQVVRTDLAELWDMDLEGAPYGYTPFCDSRAETLGFQFWRSGYWKNHLGENPYHISALYVVDLVRFRQAAVGDTLRGIYDQLSRDKNSLSNLDQDLPNFAQKQVPIKSLPIQWLWCESWCSDDSKAAAKTIDLCNNPLHKEPKLDMARRVISGPLFPESWVQLDEEVHAVLTQARAGLPHSEHAAAEAKASALAAAEHWYGTHTIESPWERAARENEEKAKQEDALQAAVRAAGRTGQHAAADSAAAEAPGGEAADEQPAPTPRRASGQKAKKGARTAKGKKSKKAKRAKKGKRGSAGAQGKSRRGAG